MSKQMKVYVVVGLALVACGEVRNNKGMDAGVGGQADATIDAPPVTTCTPNEFVDCVGNVKRTCNGAGTGSVDEDCGAAGCNMTAKRCNVCMPSSLSCSSNAVEHCTADGLNGPSDTCSLSCVSAPAPHCAYIQPNYAALSNVCDSLATAPSFQISANQTLDTSQNNNCSSVVTQTTGPEICVIRYGTYKIDAGKTLSVTGSRAFAVVTDGALTIDGTLDVSASGSTNGPGGGTVRSGAMADVDIGGGGAGFATAGGNANGGAAATNPADLVYLVGGPRPNDSQLVGSGGGGGAAILISCRGAVTVSATGLIDAGGGGGPGGVDTVMGNDSGAEHFSAGGGGAGGNVVIEGTSVSVLGQVFANGGAGGGGSGVDVNGNSGSDGTRSATVAAGGGGAVCGTGGVGGSGGREGAAPGNGTARTNAISCSNAGGGGSVGFLQTYAPMGITPTLTPSAVSPAFRANRTIQTR
jgi:hypothetical protein